MPHKVVSKKEVTKVEEEIARITKAIDRVRIYSNAKDNESVKLALYEIKKIRGAIVRHKNDAIDSCTQDTANTNAHDKTVYYRGFEKGLALLVDAFENTEEEIKHYSSERRRLEKYLEQLRKTEQR